MGRKGRQGLVDGLLVPDVCQHGGAHLHHGAIGGRDMQAALCHERKQTQCLEGDGLSASVGAGNDQRVEPASQDQVVAHGGFGVQQGMAGPAQLNVIAQHRLHGPHGGRQLSPGKDTVQGHQRLVIVLNALLEPGAVGGQLRQNALDLLLLFGLELSQLVVGVHHPHRFNKESAAGAGHVVDQAWDVVFVFAFHRHHIPPAPHGDDGILQIFGLVGRDQPVEHVPHLPRRRPDVPSDVGQFRRRRVCNLLLAEDGPGNFLLQKPVRGKAFKVAVQHGFDLAVPGAVLMDVPGAAQHLGDVQQLPGI